MPRWIRILNTSPIYKYSFLKEYAKTIHVQMPTHDNVQAVSERYCRKNVHYIIACLNVSNATAYSRALYADGMAYSLFPVTVILVNHELMNAETSR